MDLSANISGQPTDVEPGLDAALDSALEAEIRIIHAHGPTELAQAVQDLIPTSRMPPLTFLDALSPTERTDVFRASLFHKTEWSPV